MTSLTERASELSARRVPFVRATVVRAQVPSSARAGDEAIVLMDGTIEGFVGGDCAESSVRTAALGTLARAETLLLRVLPSSEEGFPPTSGAEIVVNPCLSGGALEIFLRPVLPPPLVVVAGRTPIAQAVIQIGELLGYTMSQDLSQEADAVVVAAHGKDDEEGTLRAALETGVPYVALVASKKRGQAVLEGFDAEQRRRVSTPAGLWIGARTAPEVALSIMAEVVSALRLSSAPEPVVSAVDPVCGMSVTPSPATLSLTVEGKEFWFCGEGCRSTCAAGSR